MQLQASAMLALTALFCGSVAAQIFQCTDAAGRVSYQDTACEGDSRAIRQLETSPTQGLRDGERAWLKALKARPTTVAAKTSRKAPASEAQQQEKACWKKHRQLDTVRAKLRRGYKASEGGKLRRRRRGLEDYLFRYCD